MYVRGYWSEGTYIQAIRVPVRDGTNEVVVVDVVSKI